MTTLVLSFLFVGSAAIASLLTAGAGFALLGGAKSARLSDVGIALATAYGVGLGVFGFLVVIVGLFGLLIAPVVLPVAVIVGIAGWLRVFRSGGLCDFQPLDRFKYHINALDPIGRLAVGVTVTMGAVIIANITIGALMPDNGQDSLWYHLTVPGQWVIRGDVAMFTHCMPSTYMLAINAVYGLLLLAGNEILVTSFYAQGVVVVLLAFASLGARAGGAPGGIGTALVAWPIIATLEGIAPISALNDALAMLLAGLAGWWLMIAVIENRAPSAREGAIAGWLGGTAIAGKMVTLGWVGVFGAIAAVAMLSKRETRATAPRFLTAASGTALLALAPWLVRGWIESGNPVIIISPELFSVKPEFAPVLAGYENEPTRFYSISVAGVVEAVTVGIPDKIRFAASRLDSLFFIGPILSMMCLATRGWRLWGLAILGCYTGFVMIAGFNETLKYFSTSYLLMAPCFGVAFLWMNRNLKSGILWPLLLLLMVAAAVTFARGQLRWAGHHTVAWEFRPLLTEQAQRAWLMQSENGSHTLALREISNALPPDAEVLLPNHPGPYYLQRRAHWSAYASPPILETWWAEMEAIDAHADLLRRGITHVVWDDSAPKHPKLLRMETDGRLARIPFEAPTGHWVIWRVKPKHQF